MTDYLQLTKPRLSSLVLVTVAVAYFVASPGNFDAGSFVAVLLGMALVVSFIIISILLPLLEINQIVR